MTNFEKMIKTFNSGLKYYTIVPTGRAIGEDGKYVEGEFVGYACVNSETNVTEATSVSLPACMYQATHFDDMLAGLLTAPKPSLTVLDTSVSSEDIVPN